MKRLLLLSNSTCFGQGYLDHAMPAIREHFAGIRSLLFVPFAIQDRAGYVARVRERFAKEGMEVRELEAVNAPPLKYDQTGQPNLPRERWTVTEGSRKDSSSRQDEPPIGQDERPIGADPRSYRAQLDAIESAEAFFVGGGNTFRLLDILQRCRYLDPIRRRVLAGVPYLGSSAGSGIAAPTIKTSNDMPIVEPGSFSALGLIPFQLNLHYFDADPNSRHMGETREQRILEFHEENDAPVVGVREGAWIRVLGSSAVMEGPPGGRIFRKGLGPIEVTAGQSLDGLLDF